MNTVQQRKREIGVKLTLLRGLGIRTPVSFNFKTKVFMAGNIQRGDFKNKLKIKQEAFRE